jgi:S-adenosylmethionine:tRNA ribosyltransferase-isomerase
MLVSDYSYDLPEERIAKFPPEERGSTRLLVLNRQNGSIEDSYYRNLDEFLNPGDVLILNDTRVMQSRLFCELPDGRKRELVVLEKHGDEPQRVMYRGKLHDGDRLYILDGRPSLVDAQSGSNENKKECEDRAHPEVFVKHILGNGIAEVESEVPLADLAEKYGTVPLPPYLHRDAEDSDKKRYQTVWAKNMGSAAAPTASLNMTEELLGRLKQKGVIIKYLTLHVGLGTFLPIRTDEVEGHKMHSEWFHIPKDTIAEIERVKHAQHARRAQAGDLAGGTPNARSRQASTVGETARSGPADSRISEMRHLGQMAGSAENTRPRVVALGTTVARTLEYYAKTGKTSGEDDIFIYPGFEFQIVDALLTNFHAPKSTVLMLASAFAGWDNLKNAYDYAVEKEYNFLSYGDSMFIC